MAIIEEDLKRQDLSLVSEAKHVLTLQDTVKANEETRKNSWTGLETARDFVYGFNVIGCGGNELDSACALEDSDLQTLDAVRNLFTVNLFVARNRLNESAIRNIRRRPPTSLK